MHYYKKNIGDYHKKAGRLSMLEHGAYTLLLDSCYDREIFPTEEEAIDWCWARTDEEIAAVKFVLKKFFVMDENGRYVQGRIKEEVDLFHEKAATNKAIAQKRENDRKAARAVLNEQKRSNDISTNRAPVVHEPPPNHKPLTNNHKPIQSDVVVIPDDNARENEPSTPPYLPENLEKSAQKPTRKGLLSRQLRQIGIEAAPHHVAWQDLLAYTDEEITAVAEIATQRKPNERIALNYLLRMLQDSGSRARASPNGKPEPFDPLHYALYGDWGDDPQQAPETNQNEVIDVDDSSNTTD